jgi:hypothetical protein
MEKITATVRFWYSQEFEVEIEDPNDDNDIHDKVAELANEIKVWDGNNSYTVEFDDYEIEF